MTSLVDLAHVPLEVPFLAMVQKQSTPFTRPALRVESHDACDVDLEELVPMFWLLR
jgi:hypothetical protein